MDRGDQTWALLEMDFGALVARRIVQRVAERAGHFDGFPGLLAVATKY